MEIRQCKNYNCDNVMYLGGHSPHYQYYLIVGKGNASKTSVTKGIVHLYQNYFLWKLW